MNKKRIIIISSTLVIGILLGWVIFGGSSSNSNKEDNHTSVKNSQNQTWTCSMHPQIRQNEPGNCPICGMKLIPVGSEDITELDPMAISMSPTAMQLAQVQTLEVSSGSSQKSVRLNGKVQADERLLYTQSSHIPGRIEKLTVNFTGEFVNKGEVIAYIYSPELVTAQEELFEAKKIKATQPALFRATKEKLKNWKLSDNQIEQILNSDEVIEEFPVLANVSGYVTKKMINIGDYIKQGTVIYEIADLSKVWVMFDVYESDLNSVKVDDEVNFTIKALPGKQFKGKVSYLDPMINPQTRVAQARVELPNPNYKLLPEMFVSGVVKAKTENNNQISVPKSAVMWTGKRSVVYVMHQTAKGVSFKMREVILGENLGENYIIESGLQDGDKIAVNGTFSIDLTAQLSGKPSMMNPEGGVAMTGHHHGNMDMPKTNQTHSAKDNETIIQLINNYIELKNSLVNDNFEASKQAYHNLLSKLSNYSDTTFKNLNEIKNIEDLRDSFIKISDEIITLVNTSNPLENKIYVQHCPMANQSQGASWLSFSKEIKNPYYGASMLKCGSVIDSMP
ncbi:efflux RND transporter periplasmic adaptor subunit [Flavobacterium sp. CS20]|uniref:efflux RND transporter periplasmic adaptor subunit n=1 Tax=Flavobacterium sp. CS20 TaxID=2775246 RepID=UPI001FFDB642|nr:efflux RND transporter periplasmic adaptor subunit [Flavobacterium sp. CS20]